MALAWTLEMSVESAREAERDEVRLVRASLGGDSEAFSRLVRRHERRVFKLIGRFFRQPEDVEDVAQDVFLTVWRKLATYRAKAPFEHWITRVCLNRCYERLRKHKPVEQELDDRVGKHGNVNGFALLGHRRAPDRRPAKGRPPNGER